MKLVEFLDVREAEDRRQIFEEKVKSGAWYACVASVDLRYHVPIIICQGKYRMSLPNAFRNLGLKTTNKKFFSSAKAAAENTILQAAAVLGEEPPLMTMFGPAPPEKKSQAWKRTRNVFDCQQQFGADVEMRRFRPQEIGWRECHRRVISLDVTQATKTVLLYAYDRGFESGQFYASTETISKDTGVSARHIKRILPHLAELKHFERVKRDAPKGVWRYAFLIPAYELPRGDLKSPEKRTSDPKSPGAVTLSPHRGDQTSPKADISNQKDSSRTTREREERDPDQKAPAEMDKATRSYCEKKLLDHLSIIMGPGEMLKNDPAWRLRIRFYHLAVTGAIKEYYGLSQKERGKIRNRAAWMIDRYCSYGGRSVSEEGLLLDQIAKRQELKRAEPN